MPACFRKEAVGEGGGVKVLRFGNFEFYCARSVGRSVVQNLEWLFKQKQFHLRVFNRVARLVHHLHSYCRVVDGQDACGFLFQRHGEFGVPVAAHRLDVVLFGSPVRREVVVLDIDVNVGSDGHAFLEECGALLVGITARNGLGVTVCII